MSTWKRFDNLPKGLFLASVLLLAWLAILAVFVRWNALPDVAENLPGGETEAFWMLSSQTIAQTQDALPAQMSSFMSTPSSELPWIDVLGSAWVDGQTVQFAKVSSLSEAEGFLKSLLLEGEELQTEQVNLSLWSTIACYTQGQPYCFTWIGDTLFVAGEKGPLALIQETAFGNQASLESSTNYQNVRGRLAQWNDGFYYVDIHKTQHRFMDDFGALSSLLQLFPATGGVLKLEAGTLLSENFLAVDKEALGGSAFFSPTAKYGQTLLPWTSEGMAWEWGGQDLSAQWTRIEEILTLQSPASALVWRSEAEQKLNEWLGTQVSLEENFSELLDGEQYFGFTPGEDFLFMTTLENEEELRLASQLKDQVAMNGSGSNGMSASAEHYRGVQTYVFSKDGDVEFSIAFVPGLAVVSGSKALLLSTLDKVLGQAPNRDLRQMEALLPGSDELLILHCPLLPDGTILKELWGGFNSILSTRKLFDDGVFTRSTLHVAQ